MVDAADVRDILQERPDLEGPMKATLELDEPWTFEDIDADSGEFGELVSHGVIEETAEGYHVTDRAAVRAALSDPPTENDSNDGFSLRIDASRLRELKNTHCRTRRLALASRRDAAVLYARDLPRWRRCVEWERPVLPSILDRAADRVAVSDSLDTSEPGRTR